MYTGIFTGAFLSGSLLLAQTIVGSGYAEPAPASVAPGQIATFYLAGLSTADGVSAAVEQAGISATRLP